jgi:hypothetical protein
LKNLNKYTKTPEGIITVPGQNGLSEENVRYHMQQIAKMPVICTGMKNINKLHKIYCHGRFKNEKACSRGWSNPDRFCDPRINYRSGSVLCNEIRKVAGRW